MSKNIVICSDGTGNSANKGRGTNVFKLYEAIDVVDPGPGSEVPKQVAIYDDGVGTQKLRIIRALSGAFGFGLARNVRQLYEELCRVYERDDELYLFGFSRGAFTVRTLTGLICDKGILDTSGLTKGQVEMAVRDLYRTYRRSRPALLELILAPVVGVLRAAWRKLRSLAVPSALEDPQQKCRTAKVRFVGVWDTVDAVGFPVPGISAFWNSVFYRFKFNEPKLPEGVHKAAHALAIDDERASFWPTLWKHDERRTHQVWFAGVHSNVGGGYPKQGMSLVTLHWMMRQAENAHDDPQSPARLRFREGLREQVASARNVRDYMYDSRAGAAVYYRYRPRDVAAICEKVDVPVMVHDSVFERTASQTRGYAPGNLPERFGRVTTAADGAGSDTLEKVQLALRRQDGDDADAVPPFAGPTGPWKLFRQSVQVVFFAAQAALVYFAWRLGPVTDDKLPLPADAGSPDNLGLAHWSMKAVELVVAPLPSDFAETRIVQPMFAYPWLGLSFLLVAAACFFLGLMGRARMENLNSNRWRHLDVVAGKPTST